MIFLVVFALTICSLVPWQVKVLLGTTGAAHAPLHVACFGAAAFLVSREVNHCSRVWVQLGLAALAILIETLQWKLFTHGFEWLDVLYDAAGILIVVALDKNRDTQSDRA